MDEDEEYDELEQFVVEATEPTFVSNDGSWPSGQLKYHPLDAAVCVAALAANVATSFSVFFTDFRRDLCAARNRATASGVISDFDAQIMQLASTDET